MDLLPKPEILSEIPSTIPILSHDLNQRLRPNSINQTTCFQRRKAMRVVGVACMKRTPPPLRATIPVQNGARLNWDPWIDKCSMLWIPRATQRYECRFKLPHETTSGRPSLIRGYSTVLARCQPGWPKHAKFIYWQPSCTEVTCLHFLILHEIITRSKNMHPPPPPPTTLIPHIEVGFKWMWTQLATPNKMAPVFVDLCAGLVVLSSSSNWSLSPWILFVSCPRLKLEGLSSREALESDLYVRF